jgi:hypothetical protein
MKYTNSATANLLDHCFDLVVIFVGGSRCRLGGGQRIGIGHLVQNNQFWTAVLAKK